MQIYGGSMHFHSSKKQTLIHFIECYFCTTALIKISHLKPNNLFGFIFFVLCFLGLFYIKSQNKFHHFKKNTITIGILSILFSTFYMCVDYPYYIDTLSNKAFIAIILLSVFIGLIILFYFILCFLYSVLTNNSIVTKIISSNSLKNDHIITVTSFYQKYIGICSFLICFLGYFPYLLFHFPGIMTPDSINQYEQVLGIIPYSNHHPFAHTMMIKFFFSIGKLFTNNLTYAAGFYTFFQLCFVAFSIAVFISTLSKSVKNVWILLFWNFWFALIPYHAVYAVTVWKDIPFACGVLLFACSMLQLKNQITIKYSILFTISGILIGLFRSNGFYAFWMMIPFLLYYFKNNKKHIYPLIGLMIAFIIIIRFPIMTKYQVTQPDFEESLSIPTQQIANVLCKDRPISIEDMVLIENVIDLTYIKDLYNPFYADNMKELVRAGNQDYLVKHKKEFLSLWIRLGLTYPFDYLEAYRDQTYGYYYPDKFYPVADNEGISGSDFGIRRMPLIGGPIIVKLNEIGLKLNEMVPLYGLIWSMGFLFWVFLFSIGSLILRNQYEKLFLYLPGLFIFFTVLIATPVNSDFRYVYFLTLSLPFYFMYGIL